MTKKICYILPEYIKDDYTHFAHIQDFIKEITKSADIFLLVEKSKNPIDSKVLKVIIKTNKIYVQKFKLLRFLENIIIIFLARMQGYKNFYVHYSFLSAFNASLITKIFKGKVFYWNCGLPWQYKRPWLREFFERLTYKMIDHLVTGTESLADSYAEKYKIRPEKIKVMPNWISLERFKKNEEEITNLQHRLNLAPTDKILLFVHRLSRRKGAHLLLDIFQKVNNSEKKLLIIGDGPEKENLELKIKNLKLEPQVRLLGWLPNWELPTYYALADVLLVPSEEEGFPRILLEAMAIGVPFVAFSIGGIKEIVPPEFYSNLITAGDLNAFISRVEQILLLDEENLSHLRNISLNWVKQYDVKEITQVFLRLF